MSKYSIRYFETTALGEPIKYLFAYGKLDWEEQPKVSLTQWPEIKPTLPFGKLPIVEVDGTVLHQHVAICRYLARKVGLVGNTEWDALQADIIVDTIGDLRPLVAPWVSNPDKEKATEYINGIRAKQLPDFFQKLDDIVKKNGGYFVNNQLTWADIYFVSLDQFHNFLTGDILSKYEHLDALKTKVESIPEIKKYIDNRPYFEFYKPEDYQSTILNKK